MPGLSLLGRVSWPLDAWARDWRGAEMKVALSQTLFLERCIFMVIRILSGCWLIWIVMDGPDGA